MEVTMRELRQSVMRLTYNLDHITPGHFILAIQIKPVEHYTRMQRQWQATVSALQIWIPGLQL